MQNAPKIAGPFAPETYARGYDVFRYGNTASATLDFTVRLPSDWTAYPQPEAAPTATAPVAVLLTAHGDSRDVELVVWGIHLQSEIHPVDWVDGWLRSQGFRVHDMRTAKTSYGVVADVLASRTHEGKSMLHRLATVKDGNRLFLLDGRADTAGPANADRMQQAFQGALTGFQLVNPTRERFAEPFAFFRLDGASPLQFAASQSWQIRVSPNAPDGGTAVQYENRVGEASVGTIIIVTSPNAGDAGQLEQVTLENLAASGITIVPDTAAFGAVKNTALESFFARADARRGDRSLEMLLLRAGSQSASVSAILVSPSAETDPESWAINRRAFEILIETLQPAP